jgi:hypothetical protein
LSSQPGLAVDADLLHLGGGRDAMELGPRRILDDADGIPQLLHLTDHQVPRVAGEDESSAGAFDDAAHVQHIAHEGFPPRDVVWPPVLVLRLVAKLDQIDHGDRPGRRILQ